MLSSDSYLDAISTISNDRNLYKQTGETVGQE